jgi:23S rRNA pseudouridine1911/1915/1917 synthase
MDTTPTIRLTIPPEDAGQPFVDLVAAALGGDHAEAARLIDHGGLWVDGERLRDATAAAHTGALIAIHRPAAGSYAEATVTTDQIIYEDADLIALNKPPGAYVDSTPWDADGNLHAALGRFLAARDGVAPRLHPAHRLDRDTTGVLLFSRNPAVNRALQVAFAGGATRWPNTAPSEAGLAHKEYRCLCQGAPAEERFEIATGHGRERHGRFRVYPFEEIGRLLPDGSRVKGMRTQFQVEQRLGDAALVRAFPLTGRTHQIRLHLAWLGHPLLGDLKYGGPAAWRDQPLPYHLLHAERLTLPHPRTALPLMIVAPAPKWLHALVAME